MQKMQEQGQIPEEKERESEVASAVAFPTIARGSVIRINTESYGANPYVLNMQNELLPQLRALIDRAATTIRALREENALLVQKATTLEQQVHLMVADLTTVIDTPVDEDPPIPATASFPWSFPLAEDVDLRSDPQERLPFVPPISVEEAPTAGRYGALVYPFTQFSTLSRFQTALQGVIGVQKVHVRRFTHGTLELSMEYDGAVPLRDLIRDLPVGIADVCEEAPHRLHIRLDA